MAGLSDAERENLIAELNLHKTEFIALREEILQWLNAERQNLNLSIVAVAAGLGLTPFIAEQKVFFLLLLFPLAFHVLLAEMLYSIRMVDRLSNYLLDTLIPRVNVILDKLGDDRQGTTVLGWEVRLASHPVRAPDLILASFTPTRHWMPILAIAAFILSYGVIINSQGYAPSLGEILLVFVNLLLLILAAVRNALAARKAVRKAQRLRQEISHTDLKAKSQKALASKNSNPENGTRDSEN